MMKPLPAVALGVALALAPVMSAGAQHPRAAPPMPRRLVDYCEGESCGFEYSVVICSPATLRARDESTAPAVATLHPGDTAFITTGNLRVVAPGLVVLERDTLLATDDGAPRRDTLRLARGDTVYVLEYQELGHWTLWYRGRLTDGVEFWTGPGQAYFGRGRDSLAGRSLRAPRTEFWLYCVGRGPPEAGGENKRAF